MKGRGLENNLPLEEEAASFEFDLKSDFNNIHKESVLVINGLFYLKKTDFLTVCREPGFYKIASFSMYVDYLKIWRPTASLVFLMWEKQHTVSSRGLRYLYSTAQMWAIQISNMSRFLNSKHFSKILVQQRARISEHQADIIL